MNKTMVMKLMGLVINNIGAFPVRVEGSSAGIKNGGDVSEMISTMDRWYDDPK
jgi:hypothetical protein